MIRSCLRPARFVHFLKCACLIPRTKEAAFSHPRSDSRRRPSIGQSVTATNSRSELLPVIVLLFAVCFWGVLWWPLRWLEENGIPGLWASLLLFLSACVIGLPVLWRQHGEWARQPAARAVLALSSGWCNTAFILAVLNGEVVRVLLLFYLCRCGRCCWPGCCSASGRRASRGGR